MCVFFFFLRGVCFSSSTTSTHNASRCLFFDGKSIAGHCGSDGDGGMRTHSERIHSGTQLNLNLIILTFEEKVGSFFTFFKNLFKKGN